LILAAAGAAAKLVMKPHLDDITRNVVTWPWKVISARAIYVSVGCLEQTEWMRSLQLAGDAVTNTDNNFVSSR